MRIAILVCVTAALVTLPMGASADFYLHRSINLSEAFGSGQAAGTSAYSLAYDGTSAYIGGYNASSDPGTVGIVKVDGLPLGQALATTLLPGSVISANGLEGYNSVVVGDAGGAAALFGGKDGANAGGTLIVSLDPATGVLNAGFGTAGVLNNPGGRTRIHGGIAFDPGFGGAGAGVSHMEFGQGRRQLVDAATGAEVYGITGDAAPGFVVFLESSSYRDHIFDPATGDMYLRRQNDVQRSIRSGENSVSSSITVADLTNANAIVGQNVGFIAAGAGAGAKDIVIFNDRQATTPGQAFFDQVFMVGTDGTAVDTQLLGPNGELLTLIEDGNGLYDFAFSSATGTLLISDFYNNQLYVFESSPVPEPSSLLALAAGMGGLYGFIRRRKD